MTSARIVILIAVAIAALRKRIKRQLTDARHSSIVERENRLVSLRASLSDLHSLTFPAAASLFGISSKGMGQCCLIGRVHGDVHIL
jgi:hypothetical protein